MAPRGEAQISRFKDGRTWRIGTDAEIAWIENGTEHGVAITSAIPPVFEATRPSCSCSGHQQPPDDQEQHEQAVMTMLTGVRRINRGGWAIWTPARTT
jgi:hypothetical protein